MGFAHIYIKQMIISTANTTESTDLATSIVAEFAGGQSSDVQMMIGIGIVKDSDAVFFQYVGDEQAPRALTLPTSGKPLTRLQNVTLSGLSVARDIGEFKSTKLNLFLTTAQGRTLMLTSGLTTIWSQCVLTSLMGLYNSYNITEPFTLDSWKGNSKMRPCFAAVRQGGTKVSDQELYDQLKDLRGDRAYDKLEAVMIDSIEILNAAVGVENAQVAEVTESTDDQF